jgi:tetratricopeptide (TPR) repeat protein
MRQPPAQRIEWLKAAIDSAELLDDRSSKSNHLGNLGIVYNEIGRVDLAEGCFREALLLAIESGNHKHEASQLGNLGMLFAQSGRFEQAIAHLEKCRAMMVSLGDWQGQANALGNLGLAYDAVGDFDRALSAFHEALKIFTETGNLYRQYSNQKGGLSGCARLY